MKKKRLLSVMIAIAMVLSLMPAMAFAEDSRITTKELSTKEGYDYRVDYEDVAAVYTTVDGRQLTYDDEGTNTNFPADGDRIAVTYGGVTRTYTYVDTDDETGFKRTDIADDNDWIRFYSVLSYDESGNYEVWSNAYKKAADGQDGHYVFDTYDIAMPNIRLVTDVASISYYPDNINLFSEDIKYTDQFDGSTYYDYYLRSTHSYRGQTWKSPYAAGDKITVTYKDGRTKTFVNTDLYDQDDDECNDRFVNGDDLIFPTVIAQNLKPGANKVLICYGGVSTTVTVNMDTPEKKAERDAAAAASAQAAADAAEWNGTIGAIPAAKSVKAKAAKKAVKVSWKKATKKNAKKFDKVEIQVCSDKNFQRSNTKRIEVKKSKKSEKVKGLSKKTTYYVRVRDVKGSGTGKIVSKWSKVKKVKTK